LFEVCSRSDALVEEVDTEHDVCPIKYKSMSETSFSTHGKSGEQKPRRSELAIISKGIWAVELSFNKILQFSTRCAS